MTTFDDARKAVALTVGPRWLVTPGTLFVAPWGYEDATSWRVVVGAREYLLDGQEQFNLMDAPVWLVDKGTLEVTEVPYIEHLDRLDAMTPVGTRPDTPSGSVPFT